MTDFGKFTYPFCYVPHPAVKDAACSLIGKIDREPGLRALFSGGKMLGVLICSKDGIDDPIVLYGFSGLAGGLSYVDGFVPPIFDYTPPDGYFRIREAEISSAVSAGNPEAGKMSAELQEWLFGQYIVHNAEGGEMDIRSIFALRGLVPPGGTGECAAPKLLEHAYRNNLHPLAMGEFWYGRSPAGEVRVQGSFYPSCTGKCGPLLSWMMQGLEVEPNPLDAGFSGDTEPEILYEDETIIIADKPSGMLSVPGRTEALSLLEWLQNRYGEVHSCHRLDMDTSGVMVFARTAEAKVTIELQFAAHKVEKTYRARLTCPTAGNTNKRDLRKGASGTIALPLMPDYYDRPRQMVDYENGKRAITRYEVLEVLPNGELEVLFTPLTGRTHQLRVHAAHTDGLARPIKGDRLYGNPDGDRLYLHAETIRFTHPSTGLPVTFRCMR